jgi:hypothetical protein
MASYATVRKFGRANRARVARVTDAALVAMPRHDDKPGICLRAAVIAAISSSEDKPYVLPMGESVDNMTCFFRELTFVDTETTQDAEEMPEWSWTWPPPI